jgi:hypothetical protein
MFRRLLPSAAVAALLVVPALAGSKAVKAKDACDKQSCCRPASTAKKAEAKKATVKTFRPAKPSTKSIRKS